MVTATNCDYWNESLSVANAKDVLCSKCQSGLGVDTENHCWDGKTYCQTCVTVSGLSGVDASESALEETIQFGFLQGFARGCWSAVCLTTIMALCIGSLFGLLGIAFAAEGHLNANGIVNLIWRVIWFTGIAWLFVSVVAVPISLLPAIFSRTRRFQVHDGKLHFRTTFCDISVPLDECRWRVTRWGMDSMTFCFPNRPVIQLQISDRLWAVCGNTEQTRRLWSGYFSLIDMPWSEPTGFGKWFKLLPATLTLGGVIGALIGYVGVLVSGDSRWLTVAIFLGFLDSSIASAGYLMWTRPRSDESENRFRPILVILSCAILGMKIGRYIGMTGLIVCGIANAVVGWMIAIDVRRRSFDDSTTVNEQTFPN